jgi:N-acetylneuraminic acid mutarotase
MTLLSNIICIIFGILLQLSVEVKSQTAIFKPDLRSGHTATLINNKLYILSGVTLDSTPPKEKFFYLDVSIPFNTNELIWSDLSATTNNIVPPHHSAAAVKGGANNNTLFLYGGVSASAENMALVYTFDTQSNLWQIPKTTGAPPMIKRLVNPAIDDNGLIYLFGGSTVNPLTYFNDMPILNSINLSWKQVNLVNAPTPRNDYGAVFLPNKNIIYMGM